MSVASSKPVNVVSGPGPDRTRSGSRWIISSTVDQLLILATPLLAIPAVYLLHSSLGVRAETISMIVASFFALGHHLPGMIRAYGDAELFERFRWRFIVAPAAILFLYFPLNHFHPDLIPLVIVCWATWHGLMQLYGFVRIYDAKAGSVDKVTAWFDWLICLCGFVMVQLFSPARVTQILDHWYGIGGIWLTAEFLSLVRQCALILTVTVVVMFCLNYVFRLLRGPRQNPIKLLLLASGIGTWWFAVDYVENIILGAALFDICHDVQYLAIVWIYNCRRVTTNPDIGKFMSYVFRRGMLILYISLIAAYGAIGLIPAFVENGTIAAAVSGIVVTSTLLHYYYDGFIWKVREASTQASLGLTSADGQWTGRNVSVRGIVHLLKWSPLILFVAWLFAQDLIQPVVARPRREELTVQYAKSLQGSARLPESPAEQAWLLEAFQSMQKVAEAVPENPEARIRGAILLANFGRNDEAVTVLTDLLRQEPQNSRTLMILGEIHQYRGNLEEALGFLKQALAAAENSDEKSVAFLKLGQVYVARGETEAAREHFAAAVELNPELKKTVQSRQKLPAYGGGR